MPWKPWIRIEDDLPKTEEAQALYASHRNPLTKLVPDTVRLNSLNPTVADLVQRLHDAIGEQACGLTIRGREISSLIVASLNGCVY